MDSKPFKTKISFRLPAGRLPYQSHARCSIGLLISHLWRIVCIEDWWSLPILPLIATHGRQTVNGQGRGVFLRITWWINTLHINLERHMIETIHQGTCHMMLSQAGVLRCAVGWTHSGRTLDRFRFLPSFFMVVQRRNTLIYIQDLMWHGSNGTPQSHNGQKSWEICQNAPICTQNWP